MGWHGLPLDLVVLRRGQIYSFGGRRNEYLPRERLFDLSIAQEAKRRRAALVDASRRPNGDGLLSHLRSLPVTMSQKASDPQAVKSVSQVLRLGRLFRELFALIGSIWSSRVNNSAADHCEQ